MPRAIVILLMLALPWTAAAQAVDTVDGVRRIDLGHTHLLAGLNAAGLQARTVSVILPPSYAREGSRRYPVAYVHDAVAYDLGAGDTTTARRLTRAMSEGSLDEVLIVGIATTSDRTSELTPRNPSLSSRPRPPGVGIDDLPRARRVPSLELYGDWIVDVLKPWIDTHYRTRPGRAHTATLGYSFGGLASLYLHLRHPTVFGRVGSMSGSLWWRRRAVISAFADHRGPAPTRLYLDAGDEEGDDDEAVAYMVRDVERVAVVARQRGLREGRELRTRTVAGIGHGFGYAQSRIVDVMKALMGR